MKHNKHNNEQKQGGSQPASGTSSIQSLGQFSKQVDSMLGIATNWNDSSMSLLQGGLSAMDAYGKTDDFKNQDKATQALIFVGCASLFTDLKNNDRKKLVSDLNNFVAQLKNPPKQNYKAA